MAANFEDLKKSLKNRVSSESKNFYGERHCLMCRFGWENKKKIVMGTLTPWRVGKLNIKQFPGMPRTQTSRIAGNKFSVMSLFPLYGCGRKAAT